MTILTVLLMFAMAAALMAALIRSAFSGSKPEQEPEVGENKVIERIFQPKNRDEDNGVTCISLRFYCWIANLRELSTAESGVVDESLFKGPIRLISGREDGSIRIINTERGNMKGQSCDLDISEIFPSETDELYRSSNRCFSHHEGDIIFDKDTGMIHLRASEEKAKRNRPASMYSFSTGKPITDMVLTDGSCAVIGDYLFIFTYKNELPADILCAEEESKKKTERKSGVKKQPASSKKRTVSSSRRKTAAPASGKKKVKTANTPQPTISAS